MSEQQSVSSTDSSCSECFPVSPSLLYDQRRRLYETCTRQGRRAVTEYVRRKDGRSHQLQRRPADLLPSILYPLESH